jgi:hypothetical protein
MKMKRKDEIELERQNELLRITLLFSAFSLGEENKVWTRTQAGDEREAL